MRTSSIIIPAFYLATQSVSGAIIPRHNDHDISGSGACNVKTSMASGSTAVVAPTASLVASLSGVATSSRPVTPSGASKLVALPSLNVNTVSNIVVITVTDYTTVIPTPSISGTPKSTSRKDQNTVFVTTTEYVTVAPTPSASMTPALSTPSTAQSLISVGISSPSAVKPLPSSGTAPLRPSSGFTMPHSNSTIKWTPPPHLPTSAVSMGAPFRPTSGAMNSSAPALTNSKSACSAKSSPTLATSGASQTLVSGAPTPSQSPSFTQTPALVPTSHTPVIIVPVTPSSILKYHAIPTAHHQTVEEEVNHVKKRIDDANPSSSNDEQRKAEEAVKLANQYLELLSKTCENQITKWDLQHMSPVERKYYLDNWDKLHDPACDKKPVEKRHDEDEFETTTMEPSEPTSSAEESHKTFTPKPPASTVIPFLSRLPQSESSVESTPTPEPSPKSSPKPSSKSSTKPSGTRKASAASALAPKPTSTPTPTSSQSAAPAGSTIVISQGAHCPYPFPGEHCGNPLTTFITSKIPVSSKVDARPTGWCPYPGQAC